MDVRTREEVDRLIFKGKLLLVVALPIGVLLLLYKLFT